MGNKWFFAFIKPLLAHFSLIVFTFHLIWKTLLFPMPFSYQVNIMHPSQCRKLWACSSGSNPKCNSLTEVNGPSQGKSACGRACSRVLRHQWYSSDYLPHCLPVWNPTFPVMHKRDESSKRFSHFHYALFSFVVLSRKGNHALLLRLLCFGVEFINSPRPHWMALVCTGEENWEKKRLSKCRGTVSPLSGSFWSPSNQRAVRVLEHSLLGDLIILCVPLHYTDLLAHLFPQPLCSYWGQGLVTQRPQDLAQGLSIVLTQWMVEVYGEGKSEIYINKICMCV